MAAAWYVYVARCADGTLYCGIARDVAQRIAAHDAGTGARYTRGRGPLVVVLVRRCRDHGRALRLEYAIKQLSRADKAALVAEPARLARLVRRVNRTRRAAKLAPPASRVRRTAARSPYGIRTPSLDRLAKRSAIRTRTRSHARASARAA
ncbi:MAG TPA: GIY-YIG nuclease family protein [Kofleriaceae bacterium]|nr:GIY-YIG nuclease family protein [Kofleriaceae bacterium]